MLTLRRLFTTLLLMALIVPVAHAGTATIHLDELRSGALLMPARGGGYHPAATLATHADIRITGPIARTTLTQRFGNDSDAWAEAIYAFPLPENAAVDHLRMRVGERIIEGVIQPKQKARTTYETARKSGQRAALVEQHRPNLFTTQVANIPPHGEVVVEIEYQQLLQWRDQRFSLRLPLAITPRYAPAPTTPMHHDITLQQGWALLPGEVPNVVAVQGDTRGDNRVSIDVLLDAGFALAQVASPSHAIVQTRQGDGIHIHLAEGPVPGDHDFRLTWAPQRGQAPQAAFFTESNASGDYGLLMLMPPRRDAATKVRQARELIFVIDTSGSMGGRSMRAAREALLTALDTLTPMDRFNVIEFDSDSHALFAAPRPADGDALQQARDFVRGLDADGGTEMLGALRLALAQSKAGDERRLSQLVFITDGAISNERQLFEVIHRQLGQRRLFTVGIGSAPNTHFMTEAAHFGRGSYTYIASPSEVQRKMGALFAQLDHPVLTDLAVHMPVAADVLPQPIPDLYLGQPLTLVMKLEGAAAKATVTGHLGQRPWSTRLNLGPGLQQAGIGVLWARRKIRFWERAQTRGEAADKVEQAITALAMTHHLVSRFTSLVAVDKTPVRPADEALAKHALKGALPAGLKVPLAQTGTASAALLILGLMLALLGLALRLLRPGPSWK